MGNAGAVGWSFLSAVDEMMHLRELSDRRRRSREFRRVVDRLWPGGYPARVIQVVGTNGKGSVVKFCEAGMCALGLSVGALTSPHVADVRERWSLNSEIVAHSVLAGAWRRLLAVLDELQVQFGFHDLCVLVGLLVFAEAEVDWVVVEAGIGAAYDRTTALDREGVVLTNIGDDHRNVLGPLAWQRMLNKSRSAVPGKPLVAGVPLPEDLFAGLSPAPKLHILATEPGESTRDHGIRLTAELLHQLGLTGSGEDGAAVTARRAMSDVHLVGRWHWIDDRTVVDMAHNPDAVAALVARLLDHSPAWGRGGWTAIVGLHQHRDPASVFEALLPYCAHVLCVQAAHDAIPPEELAARLGAVPVGSSRGDPTSQAPNVEILAAAEVGEALALAAELGGPTVACGSSRLVGRLIPAGDDRLRDLDVTYGWRSSTAGRPSR